MSLEKYSSVYEPNSSVESLTAAAESENNEDGVVTVKSELDVTGRIWKVLNYLLEENLHFEINQDFQSTGQNWQKEGLWLTLNYVDKDQNKPKWSVLVNKSDQVSWYVFLALRNYNINYNARMPIRNVRHYELIIDTLIFSLRIWETFV